MYLNSEQVKEFNERGILVIPRVISDEEVHNARSGFHSYLLHKGVDVDHLSETASNLQSLSSTGGSGGVLDIFYEDWKLGLNEHPTVSGVMTELWNATYARCEGIYSHPYGPFNPHRGYMYIDRVCFRVPDRISEMHALIPQNASGGGTKKSKKSKGLQRSLTPHIDCCPHRMYEDSGDKKLAKWRPIQAFVALTSTPAKNMGGFEACPGLHSEFEEWKKRRLPGNTSVTVDASTSANAADSSANNAISEPPCVGHFTPIRPKEDADIIARFEHIPCNAGDMVVWDYRIPHANSYKNESDIVREVVYVGFLPDVELNRAYAQEQLARFRSGSVPTDQWHEHTETQPCNYQFSPLGRKLMGIDDW